MESHQQLHDVLGDNEEYIETVIAETFVDALYRPPTDAELSIIVDRFTLFGEDAFSFPEDAWVKGINIIKSSIECSVTSMVRSMDLTNENATRICEFVNTLFNFDKVTTIVGGIDDKHLRKLAFIFLSLVYDNNLKQIVINLEDFTILL